MRILHLCTSLDPTTGGPANVLARLTPIQSARGHDVTIITADVEESIQAVLDPLIQADVRVHPCGPIVGLSRKGIKVEQTVREVLADGVDVVHTHGLWHHTVHFGAAAAYRAGVPYIVRPAGMLDPWSLAQKKLKKRLFLAVRGRRDLNRAAAMHYTTGIERDLAGALGLRPPGYVIPNGIDWAEFNPPPTAGRFRASIGADDSTPLVVFLSRFHHKKGLDLLLAAFAKCDRPEGTKLVLVGSGEEAYVASLRAEAERLGITESVHFCGFLQGSDRVEAMADADLFCLPSYQENFGVAVIESLASGTPVLISDQVNIYKEVEQAGAGVVVPCDVEALTQRMSAMLRDRAKLVEMGRVGRAWVEQVFPWSKIAEQVDEMYGCVVSGLCERS